MLDTFLAAAETVGTTVKRFSTIHEAVAYIQTLSNGPVAASALPPAIAEVFGPASFADPKAYAATEVAVSRAIAAIADTGSLLLELTDPTARSATALPPVHAVFLHKTAIVPNLADIGEIISRQLASSGSTYLSITTGPSRTADIERVLTIGVHGPRELHVLLMEGEQWEER